VTTIARRLGQALCAALLACAVSSGSAGADDAAAPRAALGTGPPRPEPAKIGSPATPLAEDTIVIFNRPIVTFRAPFLGVSAAERARSGHERIVRILARGGPGAVSVEKLEPGDAVKIDGALAFLVTRDDVDRLAGQTFDALEADTVAALEQVIAETREARSGRLMLVAVL
jgi:hypothetical protein